MAIKAEVNKKYRKLEIDLDGVFKKLLLLKKKKYAGIKIEKRTAQKGDFFETEQEYKGLDLVRRDWCPLSARVGREILRLVLEKEHESEDMVPSAIHDYLTEVKDQMQGGKVELREYVITKGLSKPPEMYQTTAGQPHVAVAKRMKDELGLPVTVGKEIPYIICKR